MCLLFLSLWLAPCPAQAQGGGSWSGRPCDAQGNLLDNPPHNNGFYVLTGTQNGTLSHTYPQPMINAALDYPSLYGDYLGAGSPLGIDALGLPSVSVSFPTYPGSPDTPNDRVGAYTPDFAYADNYGGNDEGSYSVDAAHGGPSSGPINGSVTGDMSGTLLCYFHMYWSGPGPQPASASFLVSTYLYAQAEVGYTGSQPPGGLSATATASDDVFNETASASAGDGASGGGVPTVSGYHLVQAAVDPSTGVAEVYVNGTTHWVDSNLAPYATVGAAWAGGGSLVQAGAIPDSREVHIFTGVGTTYHKGVAALPEENVPDSIGTLNDDTLVPAYKQSLSINPPGAATGYWSPNSGYVWTQKFPGSSSDFSTVVDPGTRSGVIGSDGSIGALKVQYTTQTNPPSCPVTTNYHLVVKDGNYGATEAADYNVKFHNEYENLNQLSNQTEYGDWTRVSAGVVSGSGGPFPLQVTMAISVTNSTDATGALAALLALQYNVPSWNTTYSSQVPRSASFQMPPGKYCWIEDQPFWKHITGTVDNYEQSGFQSQISWSIIKAVTCVSPLQDYTEQLVASDNPPDN